MATANVKRCSVKCCTNTSTTTPEKYFITFPKHNRELWSEVLGVDIGSTHQPYVCEDHFDLPEDSENYLYFKTIPNCKLVLKKDVLPHKNLHNSPKPTPAQLPVPKKQPKNNMLMVNLQQFKEENLENLRQLEQARKELNLQVKKKRKRKKKVVKSKIEIDPPSPEPSQPTFQTIAYLPTGLFNINAIPPGSTPTIGCNYLEPRTYVNLCEQQIVPQFIVQNNNQESSETEMSIKEESDMEIDNHELYYPEVQIKEEIKDELIIKDEPTEPANFEFVSMASELENAFYNEDT